jgi:hypothetical protein
MADGVLFADGIDTYEDPFAGKVGRMAQPYGYFESYASVDLTAGRNGGPALKWTNVGPRYIVGMFGKYTEVMVGLSVRVVSLEDVFYLVSFRGWDGETGSNFQPLQLYSSVLIAEPGNLRAMRGASAYANGLPTQDIGACSKQPILFGDGWHDVRVRFVPHQSAGEIDVWWDGVKVITGTGLDTIDGLYADYDDMSYVMVGGSDSASAGEVYVEDIWVVENPTGDLEDREIETLFPNGVGNSSDFTAVGTGSNNYDRVDETDPDDETTYVKSSTASQKDTYAFSNLVASNIDEIVGVMVNAHCLKSRDNTRLMRLVARSSSTEAESASMGLLQQTFTPRFAFFDEDPNTAAAWTESGVNAAEFGFKVQS